MADPHRLHSLPAPHVGCGQCAQLFEEIRLLRSQIMTETEPLCSVCRMAPAQYASVILVTDDRLCWPCFCLWYDEGVVSREAMQTRRFVDLLEGKP